MNIAVIPARGGSKRIPRKNIRDFLGKPIIAYSIEAALGAGVFDEVMVSTDDVEILEISKNYGASVPFIRNEKLSDDMTGTAPVLLDALDKYEKNGKHFSHICCLYPCAPFATSERLREAMCLLKETDADSVVPVAKLQYPIQKYLTIRNGELKMLQPEFYNYRNQDLEPAYYDAAQFYCAKVDSLRREERLLCERTLPMMLPESEIQDIDTEEDWVAAEIKYRIIMER